MYNLSFFVTNIILGAGLAMDAFSVSVADGLADPDMKKSKGALIALTFAFYQYAMPVIGWICVHFLAEKFKAFEKAVPWIALILLCYIGGKMLKEGVCSAKNQRQAQADGTDGIIREASDKAPATDGKLTFAALMIQGIATSIDALSVGFTIEKYNAAAANVAAVIIAAVTFVICMAGLKIGKTAGAKLSDKASLLGGAILIGIGIEIFVSNMF